MTRDAYTDRLLDLAYGELAGREAREVEAHAASCDACRAELERIRATRRIMAALPEEPAPERGERILVAAAREAAEARRPRRLVPRWLLGGAVAAASLAVVAVVSYRVLELAPRHDQETSLLGPSPYASPPPAADAGPHPSPLAAPAPQAEPGPAAEGGAAAGAQRAPPLAQAAPRATRREAAPPPAQQERQAFASPPPGAPPAAAPAPASAPPAAGAAARERAAAPSALRKSAAAPEARSEAADADAPAAAGRTEERTFPGCAGEAVRRVEVDARGRTVRYVREGTFDGRRLRVEHVFGPGGLLAAVNATDLDAPGAAVDPRGLDLSLPARAEDAGIDAPPRCGR